MTGAKIDLSGRKVAIMGGAKGIGAATASRLAASGARVAIWDVLDAVPPPGGLALRGVARRHRAHDRRVRRARVLGKIPMGRFGRAGEIAAMIAFLCSDECSFSTGAVFDASGGRAAW